jgi:hypothetical protein
MRNHQHIARPGVGHNSGDQPIGVEFGSKDQAFFDISRFVSHKTLPN